MCNFGETDGNSQGQSNHSDTSYTAASGCRRITCKIRGGSGAAITLRETLRERMGAWLWVPPTWGRGRTMESRWSRGDGGPEVMVDHVPGTGTQPRPPAGPARWREPSHLQTNYTFYSFRKICVSRLEVN